MKNWKVSEIISNHTNTYNWKYKNLGKIFEESNNKIYSKLEDVLVFKVLGLLANKSKEKPKISSTIPCTATSLSNSIDKYHHPSLLYLLTQFVIHLVRSPKLLIILFS